MSLIEIALLSILISGVLLIVWRKLKGGDATDSLSFPVDSGTTPTQWNFQSVAVKMAGSAGFVVLVFVTATMEMRRSKTGTGLTPVQLVVCSIVTAVIGALIGFCLTLRDLVWDYRHSGRRVPLILRAYFDWGLGSLVLWIVTIFAAGIAAIVCYGFFLMSGVRPVRP